jgi:hypothetical protein
MMAKIYVLPRRAWGIIISMDPSMDLKRCIMHWDERQKERCCWPAGRPASWFIQCMPASRASMYRDVVGDSGVGHHHTCTVSHAVTDNTHKARARERRYIGEMIRVLYEREMRDWGCVYEKAEKYTVACFGFIWQIVSNHGLFWFERFVSWFYT